MFPPRARSFQGEGPDEAEGRGTAPGQAIYPYTRALLSAIFDTKMDFTKKIESIDSEIPSPLDMPPGCPFQTRCEHCTDICRREHPALKAIGESHEVACHMFEEVPA